MDEMTPPASGAPPAPPTAGPAFLRRGLTTLVLVAATVPTDMAHMYLGTFRRVEPVAIGFILIAWLVGNLVLVLPWTALWALVSRLVRQESYFVGHLNTLLLALLCWTLTRDALVLASFAGTLDGRILGPSYAAAWAALTLLLGTHLSFVLASTARRTYAWGGLAAGGVVGLVFAVNMLVVHRAPGARYAKVTLLPRALLARSPRPLADHVAALRRLQESADRMARSP